MHYFNIIPEQPIPTGLKTTYMKHINYPYTNSGEFSLFRVCVNLQILYPSVKIFRIYTEVYYIYISLVNILHLLFPLTLMLLQAFINVSHSPSFTKDIKPLALTFHGVLDIKLLINSALRLTLKVFCKGFLSLIVSGNDFCRIWLIAVADALI